jgi:hypothetical protein
MLYCNGVERIFQDAYLFLYCVTSGSPLATQTNEVREARETRYVILEDD